jgi:hypothetical protein
MTRTMRRTLMDVYGVPLKAGWGEATDRAEEPAAAPELERQAEFELKSSLLPSYNRN